MAMSGGNVHHEFWFTRHIDGLRPGCELLCQCSADEFFNRGPVELWQSRGTHDRNSSSVVSPATSNRPPVSSIHWRCSGLMPGSTTSVSTADKGHNKARAERSNF